MTKSGLFCIVRRPFVNCLLIASAAFVIGCGETVKDAKKGLVSVTGKVTLNGTALTTGTISFTDGKSAFMSPISSGGAYSLGESPSSPGALPGDYRVRIVSTEAAAAMKAPEPGKPPEVVAAKSLIPEKYSSFDTSGLTATVKNESNTINFDLKP